jgi:uncharacterized hydrophobic protein (TIGR00271 family)
MFTVCSSVTNRGVGSAEMLQMRVLVEDYEAKRVGDLLERAPSATRVVRAGTDLRNEHVLLVADIQPDSADAIVLELERAGVDAAAIQLVQLDSVATIEAGAHSWLATRSRALVWTSVVSQARENAVFSAKYAVFMAIAGVIAAIGVLSSNTILIVGAMAISPDLVPVTSAAVGIVGRRPRLLGRSLATLGLGFLCAIVTAAITSAVASGLGLLPSGYVLRPSTDVSTLTQFGALIMTVAFVAGVAGILAFETRASAAVGVAISVTTIPAAALVGCGLGLGQHASVLEGGVVLAINVLLLIAGATTGLAAQRATARYRVTRDKRAAV